MEEAAVDDDAVAPFPAALFLRACFFASRKDIEAKELGNRGDVWRSMNMFCPFLTRMSCVEHVLESGFASRRLVRS